MNILSRIQATLGLGLAAIVVTFCLLAPALAQAADWYHYQYTGNYFDTLHRYNSFDPRPEFQDYTTPYDPRTEPYPSEFEGFTQVIAEIFSPVALTGSPSDQGDIPGLIFRLRDGFQSVDNTPRDLNIPIDKTIIIEIGNVNAAGLPTDWNIHIGFNGPLDTFNYVHTSTSFDEGAQGARFGGANAFIENSPGIWKFSMVPASAVPEPLPLIMLLLGFAVIWLARKFPLAPVIAPMAIRSPELL